MCIQSIHVPHKRTVELIEPEKAQEKCYHADEGIHCQINQLWIFSVDFGIKCSIHLRSFFLYIREHTQAPS